MRKAILIILGLVVLWFFAAATGWLGSDEGPGEIREVPRPAATNLPGVLQVHRGRKPERTCACTV